MAATPYYKCTTPEHGYCASFKYIEDAAQFAATHDGCQIRSRWGTLLWHEGKETQSAFESFDHVAEVAASRDKGTVNPQA